MGSHVLRLSLLTSLLMVAACGTTQVSSEKARTVERQLLLPYLQPRTVACNELVIEISPNFHRHVSNPGADPARQRFERVEKVAQVDKVWTNLRGDRGGWFTVTVGAPADPTEVGAAPGPRTTFKVMNQFKLRVLERGRMRLDSEAKGPIVIVQEGGAAPRDLQSFTISDGVVGR